MSETARPVVETKQGKLEGLQEDGVYVFKGIPYATPPIGPRRWLPPQAMERWTGVRSAKTIGGIAPQNPSPLENLLHAPVEGTQDEDCLYLNVWSPGLDDRRRPVLFWIHGGAFMQGAGSRPLYNGVKLCRGGDVVLVTINYRLGALGFLNLNEVTGGQIPATGNEGMLDQIAALEWVHDNVASFGGDPDNVTIFGESAGGLSVGTLLAMPAAKGLFHKAILQSGAASSLYALDRAVDVARTLLGLLGVESGDTEVLRTLSPDRLLGAAQRLAAAGSLMAFRPVVDGRHLLKPPLDAIREGTASGIPVLVGSTEDEAKLGATADQSLASLTEEGLLQRLCRGLPREKAEKLVETYRNARMRRGQPADPADLLLAIQTDRAFRLPAIRLAEARRAASQAAFCYLVTWRSPGFPRLGACHAIDVGFVFGTHAGPFFGSGPAADTFSRKVREAWTTFARTGNPSCESIGPWPMYGHDRETMLLGIDCVVAKAPYEDERRAWDSIPEAAIGSL